MRDRSNYAKIMAVANSCKTREQNDTAIQFVYLAAADDKRRGFANSQLYHNIMVWLCSESRYRELNHG